MDRRRGLPLRPVSNEETECWAHASESLSILSTIYANATASDTIGRVNRLINGWPIDETIPAEGLGGLKTIQQKLISGLQDIITASDQEVEAIEDVIERVGILIALRKASETQSSAEKRNKRPRPQSPAVSIPAVIGNTRSVSITVPPRTNSVGPTAQSRDSRNKKDSIPKTQPLQPERKVAFRPPPQNQEESNWILAIIKRCLGTDKYGYKYEVQDAEPQDDGQPGAKYNASGRVLLPLPDPDAPPSSPSHLSHFPDFTVGAVVMALYPDTSCFYRAEVIATRTVDRSSANKTPVYKVKFEDDEDMEHSITAHFVVDFPAHLH